MNRSTITEVQASGEAVFELVQSLEPILIESTPITAIVAMLSIVITIQNPDLSPEKLQEGVKGASEWIGLWLSSLDETPSIRDMN